MSDTAAVAMDQMYRYQRYIYDLTRKPYLFGRDRMIAGLRPPPGAMVLEVGCGTARNLLVAARHYPDAVFFGVDVSAEMLKTAKTAIDRSPYRGAITVAHADATDFDARTLFGRRGFDRIFISYALSMIPPWEKVIENALAQLAPNGELHIVDFGRMDRMPRLASNVMRKWLAAFSVIPRRDLVQIAAAAGARRGLACDPFEGQGGYSIRVVLRRPARRPESNTPRKSE